MLRIISDDCDIFYSHPLENLVRFQNFAALLLFIGSGVKVMTSLELRRLSDKTMVGALGPRLPSTDIHGAFSPITHLLLTFRAINITSHLLQLNVYMYMQFSLFCFLLYRYSLLFSFCTCFGHGPCANSPKTRKSVVCNIFSNGRLIYSFL